MHPQAKAWDVCFSIWEWGSGGKHPFGSALEPVPVRPLSCLPMSAARNTLGASPVSRKINTQTLGSGSEQFWSVCFFLYGATVDDKKF